MVVLVVPLGRLLEPLSARALGAVSFTGSVRRARAWPTISLHRACRPPAP